MKLHSIALGFSLLLPCTQTILAKPRPNILFVFADDMGYGDLGCYGSTQIKTPHIDELATGGMKFTSAYAPSCVCAPSRAGLLTGRYQQRFGFEHNLSSPKHVKPQHLGIPLDEILISDRLKELGYHTGAIGKWHVGEHLKEHHPNSRGFDYFYGMLGGGHSYFPTAANSKILRNRERVTTFETPYLTDVFTNEAIEFMKPDSKEPWFLYLSYNSPHTPMQAKKEDLERFSHIKKKRRQSYCAMQSCMDQNIGKILNHLKKTDQLNNTLIVFFNDNGGSVGASSALNAPLNGMKGMFLEGGIRVPMIMHWPGEIKANSTFEKSVIGLDFAPTLVGIAGGEIKEETSLKGGNEKLRIRDGVDLMPYIRGENKGVPHKSLFWRIALRGGAMRQGDWKLVLTPHTPIMLFNLKDDISEQNNLAAKMPEKVVQMRGDYNHWVESFKSNPIWMSSPFWAKHNRNLYEKKYQITQPKADSSAE